MFKVIAATAFGLACIAFGVAIAPRMFHVDTITIMTSPASPPSKPNSIKPEDRAENILARKQIRQAVDQFLTGDPNGDEVWDAPPGPGYKIYCGVTPDGRYIVQTGPDHGSNRIDEPERMNAAFIDRWVKAGCEKTSPVNTRLLERAKQMDEMAWLSRPQILACTMRDLELHAKNDWSGSEALLERTHHCRDPSAWAVELNKLR